jgi:predicted Zn-dependent peptidase
MEKISIQKTKNCQILTIPNEKSSGILVLALIKTGSRNEPKNKAGIAHFVEHLLFDGTKKRPNSTELSKEIDIVGGSLNGFTGKELTGYFVKVLPENINIGLDVISDMIFNSSFKESDIKKEKSVISEEIKMDEDTPSRYILEVIEELLWPKTNLGRFVVGSKKTINSIKKSDVLEFLKYYNYQNSYIVISGNQKNLDMAKKTAEKFFKFQKTKTKIDKLKLIKQSKPNIKIINKNTEQSHLAIAFRTVDINNKEKYALKLMSNILGENMSSRLFDIIRTKKALAYYIRSQTEYYQDAGFFQINAGIAHKNVQKTIDTVLNELEKMKKIGPNKTELKNAKQNVKGVLKLSLDDVLSTAEFYGTQAMFCKKILGPDEIVKIINKVTAKDIQKVANKYLDFNKINVALIGKGRIKI